MRLFIGIPLPTKVKRELSAISSRLRSADDGLRWSSPESWHITLQFLGNVEAEQYESVVLRLRDLRCRSIAVSFEGLSFLGNSVLIARVKPSPRLLELHQRVTKATESCGFISEFRTYRPHVTLARGRERRSAILHRGVAGKWSLETRLAGFRAVEFLLYESFLESSGSRYEIRERFPLRDI